MGKEEGQKDGKLKTGKRWNENGDVLTLQRGRRQRKVQRKRERQADRYTQ